MAIYAGPTGGIIRSWASGNSVAAPSQTQSGTILAGLHAGGWYTGSPNAYTLATTAPAQLNVVASQAFTSSALGTYFSFWTTTNGAASAGERLRIDHFGSLLVGTTLLSTSANIKLNVSGGQVALDNGDLTGSPPPMESVSAPLPMPLAPRRPAGRST